jgi:alpha-L-rhamnosidase
MFIANARSTVSLTVSLPLALLLPNAPASARSAAALSRSSVAASSAWERYVISPGQDGFVYPQKVEVVGTAGSVTNPGGLRRQDGQPTVVEASGPGTPRLVLDLGANTGGWVEIGITQGDGTQVRLGYSELREYLTANGDNCCANSLGANDDPNGRTDVFATSSPGDLRSPGIRGAERYISLQLEAAGSVSIDYVRVRQQNVRAAEADYPGHFLSSDKLLNRV